MRAEFSIPAPEQTYFDGNKKSVDEEGYMIPIDGGWRLNSNCSIGSLDDSSVMFGSFDVSDDSNSFDLSDLYKNNPFNLLFFTILS